MLKIFVQSLRHFDWILILVVFALTAIGLATIYSVDLSRGAGLTFFPTQVIAGCIGLVSLFVIGSLHISVYRYAARLLYIFALFLLVGVLFYGVTIRGTTGWFRFVGFSFQPVEFAKVALILFLAYWIDRYQRRFRTWQFFVTTAFFTFLYVVFVLIQPDLGSAVILAALWFCLLLLTGTKRRYIFAVLGGVVAAFFIGWFFLFADYQKERILTFVTPSPEESLAAGYNVRQSIIAIGSGKLFGRGLGFGSQSQLQFLPEAQTDFIFSVIGEELGFVGVGTVLTLFGLLLYRLLRIAKRCRDDFGAFTVLGIALLFFIQLCINMGATVGILPVTGVPLPFVSYGGSSLIINFLLIGVVQSVRQSNERFGSLPIS